MEYIFAPQLWTNGINRMTCNGKRHIFHYLCTQEPVKQHIMTNKELNKNVFQSYILTTAKYDFSVYEKRILYRLVEMAQDYIPQNTKFKDGNMRKIQPSPCGVDVTMRISDILRNEKDKNHEKAKKAFTALQMRILQFQNERFWFSTSIIEHPCIELHSGIVKFHVYRPVFDAILDFSKGYRKFELLTAMSFKSIYAMRFYELMAGQKTPLFVPLEGENGLKERFGLQKKYKLVADFQRKVLNAAKAELDAHSPYSFEYTPVKEGRKTIGFTFFPVFFEDRQDPSIQEAERMAKVTARLQTDGQVYDYLRYTFNFTVQELNRNKKTIVEAQNRIPNFVDFLAGLREQEGFRTAKNKKGYIIKAIKTKLAEL